MSNKTHRDITTAKDAVIARQREALAQIAKQKTTEEMDEHERDRADFEGGYDALVLLARSTINP